MEPVAVVALVWMLLPFVLAVLWFRARSSSRRSSQEATALKERFAPVVSLDTEIARMRDEADAARREMAQVRSTYAEKRELLDQLEQQVAVYDERLSFAELGVYEPHFDFSDSEEYKDSIRRCREEQKRIVSDKSAVSANNNWTVDGSKSKGQTMINRQTKLTLRAFNNECEAAIANVRWNNVNAMEKRIRTSASQIDGANASMNLQLEEDYIELRIEELRLTHEYREKQKAEKEERAEMARAEREEKKLLAEAEAAEKKEREYKRLLDKARSEVGADQSKIAELEALLAEAHSAAERAQAMATMTKSGYVYVISNVGSFGEDVVKIGLTRRLDPDDRVRELGDASVPFGFDVHAMIYSEEAPALESALHREFAERRINMTNFRKEFFRVGLEEVEEAVARLAPSASFFKDREAQEWHETMARRNETLAQLRARVETALPAEI
ncbi:DUF4041 domain-containing protein [Paracoccus gahaiensis]|uniref:DUF4041 domain-containing protein n=1 Tax=Paracoccus gahaiensis TaxID=1706839 RepID=A0A4U0RC92_9RHOB|nr:DUF4041 domain-containing protein [Paracoccus gahaiensis]TJZ92132.1 DUF4041 domain-containing protein [Paracoccus gahaiensis]